VLIAADANVAHANSNRSTALHSAASSGCTSICRVLVDEGASPTAVNSDGNTPLEIAKEKGHAECVAILEVAVAAAVVTAAAYAFFDEHIATTIGFRFAITKAAEEQAPHGLDKQIFDAAWQGKLDVLLGLCKEWAGHAVIDSYRCMKIEVKSIRERKHKHTFTCSLTHQTNASWSFLNCK